MSAIPIWDYIVLDGKSSLDFNVKISEAGDWGAPAYAVERAEVPGRSGDLIYPGGRFANATLTYDVYCAEGFEENFAAYRAFLMAHSDTYYRLESSFHPDEYRLARVSSQIEPTVIGRGYAGSCSVQLDAMPQRWLTKGEIAVDVTAASTICNPTRFSSRPLIRISGAGILGLGSKHITVAEGADSYIDVDVDLCLCYEGSSRRGDLVTLDGEWSDYELQPGDTGISVGDGITKVEITPRWYTI